MIGQLYQSLYRIKNGKEKKVKKVYSKGEGVSSYFQRCLQIEMKEKKKKWEKKRKLGSVLVREERSCRGERCAVGRVAFVNFVDKTRRVLTARREAPGARPRERAPR